MISPFTFVIFLAGILIAQAISSAPPQSEFSSTAPSSSSNTFQDVATIDDDTDTEEDNNPAWILPGFDKHRVSQVDEIGRKCWTGAKYNVCLIKTRPKTMLYWNNEKKNTKVRMEISKDGTGEIVQDWTYEDDNVQLRIKEDNSMTQFWKLGKCRLEWSRNSDGKISSRWYGSEDPESVEKFKQFINSWCANNDFFVGTENCAIYAETTKVNNEPAWILPGFNKNLVSRLSETGRKCWTDPKYYVCLTRTKPKTTLFWNNEKRNTKVKIEVSSNGDIYQDWTKRDGNVQIYMKKDGSMTQHWKLRWSTLQLNKYPDGTSSSKWYAGIEDPETLKKYQQFIDSWCENNDYFIGKDNCVIYSK